MTDNQQREAARQFFYKWQGRRMISGQIMEAQDRESEA